MSTGLYKKYEILKDGKPVTGRYFVLKPESDPTALEALRTYARHTHNVKLQADLFAWIDEIQAAIGDVGGGDNATVDLKE